jgi:alkylation response protein AidB-like acyl-CoA dehydrogenase
MSREGLELGPIHNGRADLAAWVDAQPTNFYHADDGLERALAMYLSSEDAQEIAKKLERFGAEAAHISALVSENNLHRNLPRLDSHDGIGRRIDEIVHHPSYHEVGAAIYGSGVMEVLGHEKNPNLYSLALFYLSQMNGEAGHNCPLACTAGIIKILQHVATDALRERYLPGFLNPEYDARLHGAQFLTEVQGGSDVGANATTAFPTDETGVYEIHGQKWFCSNIDADLTLITARIEGGPKGTKGLGLFLIPLRNEDGSRNGHEVWRLKDKIGTRSMASSEITLMGAKAYLMGDESSGFHAMMTYVIHSSRIYNAFATLGHMRRATLVGWGYAQYRGAFGHKITRYPLVQQTLAAMRSDTAAVRAACMRLVAIQDALETGRESSEEARAAQRMAVNINKTVSARYAHDVCNQGIELLGGNGAIESFSVLPRLLRDNVVTENWEGTHNTLTVQWLRDVLVRDMDEPFNRWLRGLFTSLPDTGNAELDRIRNLGLEATVALNEATQGLKDLDPALASLRARTLSDHSCNLMYAACLAHEAAFAHKEGREDAEDTTLLLQHFWINRVTPTETEQDAGYLSLIERISARV